ncbi:MAG: ATP-binding cassette domain-containing protein [bacterium]
MITVKNLTKQFKTTSKSAGLIAGLRNIWKPEYQTVTAVQDISFQINQGEMIGFIGPNGAGKTTTLKMLCGILYPTSGSVDVLGYKPSDRKNEFLKQISMVMGQKNQLIQDLPPIDSFELNRETYGISKSEFKETVKELSDVFGLKTILTRQTRRLSLGERMKCEMAAALLHKPKILFLDEPTIGLDIITQKKLRQYIKTYNERYHTTIILTSHYMDDVKEIADRIIIINHGSLIFDNTLTALIKKYATFKTLKLILNQVPTEKTLRKLGLKYEFKYPEITLQVSPSKIAAVTAHVLKLLDVDDIDIAETDLTEIATKIFESAH